MDDVTYLVDVFVAHEPEQAGSKNAFPLYVHEEGYGRTRKRPMRRPGEVVCEACGETDGAIIVNVTDENTKVKAYQRAVEEAVAAVAPLDPDAGERAGYVLLADFYLPRPQSHYGTGRNVHLVKDNAPARPVTTPDEDKLLRATQDGLADLLWKNDSQVVTAVVQKWYAVPTTAGPGVGTRIRIRLADEQRATDLPVGDRARVILGTTSAAEDDAQASLLLA